MVIRQLYLVIMQTSWDVMRNMPRFHYNSGKRTNASHYLNSVLFFFQHLRFVKFLSLRDDLMGCKLMPSAFLFFTMQLPNFLISAFFSRFFVLFFISVNYSRSAIASNGGIPYCLFCNCFVCNVQKQYLFKCDYLHSKSD